MRVRLSEREQAVTLRGVVERIRAARARGPRVLFDLDGTLIDNRPRTSAIFRELAEAWRERLPEHAERLERALASQLVFSLRENLTTFGVLDEQHFGEAVEFWKQRFFFDEFLSHDQPAPGAREFAQACYDAGATIVYFTGRDLQNMALGTVRSLRDHGFPIGVPGVELVLKPRAELHDLEYKRTLMPEVERGGVVLAGFDNEPANCNLFKECFPESDVFLLDTGHLPNPPELRADVVVLGNFRMDA